jgi:hypothetical protein
MDITVGLHPAGGHEIRDIALRGSAADYLVDESNYLLEIAGRSRRGDFGSAWQQKWQRLTARMGSGFYVVLPNLKRRRAGWCSSLSFGRDSCPQFKLWSAICS